MLHGILANLERLQKAKYCADSMNLVILDSGRPLVAKLVCLFIDKISTLIQYI